MGSITPFNSVEDTRTDAEILASLQQYKEPSPNERNVWAFWDTGLAASPPWNQRNVISWIRRLGPSWTVHVLDLVEGSDVHVSKYVDSSFFPETFNKKTMEGPHIGPHMADLVRLPLLYLYGGVWLDVGFFLFRGLDDLCWNELSDPNTPYEFAGFMVTFSPTIAMIFNGFIAARKGNLCVKYWHETFVKVWEGQTTTKGMNKNPLLAHLPKYEPPTREGKRPPFMYAQFVDYIAQVFCLERLRHVIDPAIGWDGPKYFQEKVLMFDCVKEVYWAQRITMWDGRKQFNLLCEKKEDVEHGEKWKEAEAFVQGVLSMSSTMKVSHGLPTPGREYLSEIWDSKENWGKDNEKGTWAEYLRWAGIHYEQKNPLEKKVFPTFEGAVLNGGVLEVVGTPRADE